MYTMGKLPLSSPHFNNGTIIRTGIRPVGEIFAKFDLLQIENYKEKNKVAKNM